MDWAATCSVAHLQTATTSWTSAKPVREGRPVERPAPRMSKVRVVKPRLASSVAVPFMSAWHPPSTEYWCAITTVTSRFRTSQGGRNILTAKETSFASTAAYSISTPCHTRAQNSAMAVDGTKPSKPQNLAPLPPHTTHTHVSLKPQLHNQLKHTLSHIHLLLSQKVKIPQPETRCESPLRSANKGTYRHDPEREPRKSKSRTKREKTLQIRLWRGSVS
jgi:hypothetical protein